VSVPATSLPSWALVDGGGLAERFERSIRT